MLSAPEKLPALLSGVAGVVGLSFWGGMGGMAIEVDAGTALGFELCSFLRGAGAVIGRSSGISDCIESICRKNTCSQKEASLYSKATERY